MKLFNIIRNATSETHKTYMDCELIAFKTFMREFIQSKEDSNYNTSWTKEDKAKYHIKCAQAVVDSLLRMGKHDEVVYRTVSTLYKEEIAEAIVEVAYHKDEES